MLLDVTDALCVCHLQELLELPQSTISRHLSLVRERAVVTDTRRGTWVIYYRLNTELPDWALQVIHIARANWAGTEEGRQLIARAQSIFDLDICGASHPSGFGVLRELSRHLERFFEVPKRFLKDL